MTRDTNDDTQMHHVTRLIAHRLSVSTHASGNGVISLDPIESDGEIGPAEEAHEAAVEVGHTDIDLTRQCSELQHIHQAP